MLNGARRCNTRATTKANEKYADASREQWVRQERTTPGTRRADRSRGVPRSGSPRIRLAVLGVGSGSARDGISRNGKGRWQVTEPNGERGAEPVSTPARDAQLLERTVFEVKRVIVGQDRLVERILVGLLAKGHILLEGVPGVAKTLAVETFADVVGGSFSRLQFTPDLVPADILGTRIYRQNSERFDVELGPVLANFVLTDEINRAPAKVQSALLEVMAERHVSIGGQSFPMPSPFLVLATQNPIENEGVYPLPEAQRDHFLFKLRVEYPSAEEEREIVYRMGVSAPEPQPVLNPEELTRLQEVASKVFVHHALSTTWCGCRWRRARPPSTGSRTSPGGSPTAPRLARAWAWCRPRGRWRCCGAGTT